MNRMDERKTARRNDLITMMRQANISIAEMAFKLSMSYTCLTNRLYGITRLDINTEQEIIKICVELISEIRKATSIKCDRCGKLIPSNLQLLPVLVRRKEFGKILGNSIETIKKWEQNPPPGYPKKFYIATVAYYYLNDIRDYLELYTTKMKMPEIYKLLQALKKKDINTAKDTFDTILRNLEAGAYF